MNLTSPDLAELLVQARETRRVEFKGPGEWPQLRGSIIQAAMAMANTPDGGTIIVGVEEKSEGEFDPVGMTEEASATFVNDDIQAKVNEYADPHIALEVSHREWGGRRFVAIQVAQFEELPVVCKRDGEKVKRGQVYVRAKRMNESVPISTSEEMREVLQRAIDVGVARIVARMPGWGIQLGAAQPPELSDSDKFDGQIRGL